MNTNTIQTLIQTYNEISVSGLLRNLNRWSPWVEAMLPTLPLLRIEQTTFLNVIQGLIKYDMYYQLLLSLSKAKVQTIAFQWKDECSSISSSLPVQIFNQVLWCGWVLHFIAYDCISSLDLNSKVCGRLSSPTGGDGGSTGSEWSQLWSQDPILELRSPDGSFGIL